MSVQMSKAAAVFIERVRQRMFALHQLSLQPAAVRVGHRSTRLTSTSQYRAAQLLRLAEEKGVKTLGNTWYVSLLFSFSFSLLRVRAMNSVRSIRRAILFKWLVWSTTTGSGSTFTDQHHTAAVRIQQVRRHGAFLDLVLFLLFARVYLSWWVSSRPLAE